MIPSEIAVLGLLILPLLGAVAAWALGPSRPEAIRWLSLAVSCGILFLALLLAWRFVALDRLPSAPGELPTFHPQFVPGAPGVIRDPAGNPRGSDPHRTSWNLLVLGRGVVQFYVGVDGFSIWLVVLTAVLSVPAVLISWKQVSERVNEFYAWLLLLQMAMIGIFLSFDIILFYVFFELSLVPLFFLIGIWGGPQRRHAAGKFFIYTLTGSLITLLGVLGIVLACQSRSGELTFAIPRLMEIVHGRLGIESERGFWLTTQYWVFLALTAGFAVKVPLVPFHTWLPLAHVEAPTAGSVDLAGVLLKVGAYGFLRLCVPLAPDVSLALGLPLISALAVIGIVYGACCAYAQDDIKKMVAYSSVSHLGLCMLAMFALNPAGLAGSLMQMINHGLSTAALFLLVGMLYERYHTRKISDFGGMAKRLPLLSACMVFICLTSVGLPGLNGFIGEALALFGIFDQQYSRGEFPWYAAIASSGLILGAWYLFTMLQKVFFGPLREPEVFHHDDGAPIGDLNGREIALIAPIMALCVFVGVHPQPILNGMRPEIETVSRIAEHARARVVAQESVPVEVAGREP
jgi:NADH-quinone oxidoreductase subunit M